MIKAKALLSVLFLVLAVFFRPGISTKNVIYDEEETTSFHNLKELDEALNKIHLSSINENNRLT